MYGRRRRSLTGTDEMGIVLPGYGHLPPPAKAELHEVRSGVRPTPSYR